MNEHPDAGGISIFFGAMARDLLLSVERQAGEAGVRPSSRGFRKGSLQAVEKKKIIDVSVRLKNDLFSAGNGLAKMGNSLGHGKCIAQTRRTARELHRKHLSKGQ